MIANQDCGGISPFETLYMIGDNPSVDIKGAQEVSLNSLLTCSHWQILVATSHLMLIISPVITCFINLIRRCSAL